MANKTNYKDILREYPEYITKDQLYRICHVSKRTALYYLKSGLIPCKDSGKKTRRYTIRTRDVITFLKKHDRFLERYRATSGWYCRWYMCYKLKNSTKTRQQLERYLEPNTDVMGTSEIARVTGYSLGSIVKWCTSGKLKYFSIRHKYLIPKPYLIDFMTSKEFDGIKIRSGSYKEFVHAFTAGEEFSIHIIGKND